MQFPGKLMNQTSENYKKPNFWSVFGPFPTNLPPPPPPPSRRTNESNLIKWQKTKLRARFWPVLTWKFGPKKSFSWVLPILNVIYCCKLLLHAISRKTNKPNLRK